ncbi:MAG: RDD family protein [Rhodoglobus sp.]
MNQQQSSSDQWPGKRIGLPADGPRSIGRLGRRLVAIAIDWALAVVISIAFFNYDAFATMGVFVTAQIVLLLTANGSFGHLVTGLRVVPLAGGYLGVWRPVVRTLLLAIVIPAVIWDADQRGMHDRLAGTLLVRR